MGMRTKDQKFVRISKGVLKALIDVEITHERHGAPSLAKCRHAVLTLGNTPYLGDKTGTGYVVYDRILCRIVNGVYSHLEDALASAYMYNLSDDTPQDMNPNGYALGLIYPDASRIEDDLAS